VLTPSICTVLAGRQERSRWVGCETMETVRCPDWYGGIPPKVGARVTSSTVFSSLAELSEHLDRTPSLRETAEALAAFARTELGVDEAGIALHDPSGVAHRLASTSPPLLTRLDDARKRLGQGPGLEPVPQGVTITVDDALGDTRWPAWSAHAAALSVRGIQVLGLSPMRGRGVSLDLYSRSPHGFRVSEPASSTLVRELGLALHYVDRVANLEDAVQTRALIGRAQGIVMERYGLTAVQAMSFLRRTSQESQVKLRHLAAELTRSVEPTEPRQDQP
jgi:hypothetical protein